METVNFKPTEEFPIDIEITASHGVDLHRCTVFAVWIPQRPDSAIDKCVDRRAWISEQMESWHKEGMRYVRVTEDSAHNILWAEFWKVPPRKEAPFHGWYTSSHPTTEK